MATPVGVSPRGSGYSTPNGCGGSAAVPLLGHRVLDSRNRHKLAVERHFGGRRYRGLHWYYLSDLFHTLVNCPWPRFYLVFVVAYVTMYSAFAAFYISQPGCITKVSNFWHALWFSVESSATIGYGHQAPDPQCYLLQFGVMAQVLVSLMMQGSLLGLVFARISNSSGRSSTIRFSQALSMYQGEDGLWRLAFRVANMRQHQVLQPEVRMLLLRRTPVHPFSSVHWEFIYSELKTEHVGGGRLWLGVPSVIEHRIDQGSPLWAMSDADMRAADLEIIVLLDGIDESTSRAIEARHSYVPSDIRWQHHFNPCIQRRRVPGRRSGKIGVDFSLFDATQQISSGLAAAGSGTSAASAAGVAAPGAAPPAAAPVPVASAAAAAAGLADIGSRSFKFDEPRPTSAAFLALQPASNDTSAAAARVGMQQQQEAGTEQRSPFADAAANRAGAPGNGSTDMV